jgi:hypothetical protein
MPQGDLAGSPRGFRVSGTPGRRSRINVSILHCHATSVYKEIGKEKREERTNLSFSLFSFLLSVS